MNKIMVIGAGGTIGKAVADRLAREHEVIRVGFKRGDHLVDLSSKHSIETLFAGTGAFDAIVSAAGQSRFGRVDEASDEDYAVSVANKLMGQINLVRLAPRLMTIPGSITLTTGLLGREPWPATAPTAMVNAGLEGLVRAAALDFKSGIRINAVSPIFVTETARAMGMDTADTMSAAETARAYQASVEGDMTGQTLDVRDYGKVEGDA